MRSSRKEVLRKMSQAADSQSNGSTDIEDNDTGGIVITNKPQTEPSAGDVENNQPEAVEKPAAADEEVAEASAVDEPESEPQSSDSVEDVEESSPEASDAPDVEAEDPAEAGEADEAEPVEEASTDAAAVEPDTDPASSAVSDEVTESDTVDEPEAEVEAEPDDLSEDESETPSVDAEEAATEEATEDGSTNEESDMSNTQAEPEPAQTDDGDFSGVDEDVKSPPQEFDAIVEASTLKDAIDSVGVLVDECKIRTSPEGLQIRAVDPANVGMVDLTLSAPAFESLNTDVGILGISWDRFEKVIGLANSGDLVHLDYDHETRKLNVEINGLSYTLALIDPDSIRQEPEIPALNLPADVTVEGSQIARGVKAADMVSDHIRLSVDDVEQTFSFSAEGDTDDVDLELDADSLVALSSAAPANSLFSLDYLKDMNKAIPKKAEVTMELGEEFPIKLHFGFAEGHGQTTFMLAPRIQSD
ncbi:DNA polymerase sliding clamp domain protein [Halorubrum sp. AJ67]|nr:DNA polymerase sliding clamp domain protein [Halorubrum sp. AJ67]